MRSRFSPFDVARLSKSLGDRGRSLPPARRRPVEAGDHQHDRRRRSGGDGGGVAALGLSRQGRSSQTWPPARWVQVSRDAFEVQVEEDDRRSSPRGSLGAFTAARRVRQVHLPRSAEFCSPVETPRSNGARRRPGRRRPGHHGVLLVDVEDVQFSSMIRSIMIDALDQLSFGAGGLVVRGGVASRWPVSGEISRSTLWPALLVAHEGQQALGDVALRSAAVERTRAKSSTERRTAKICAAEAVEIYPTELAQQRPALQRNTAVVEEWTAIAVPSSSSAVGAAACAGAAAWRSPAWTYERIFDGLQVVRPPRRRSSVACCSTTNTRPGTRPTERRTAPVLHRRPGPVRPGMVMADQPYSTRTQPSS